MLGGKLSFDGKEYSIFYVEYKSKTRLDIAENDAMFMVDYSKVLYGRVTARKVLEIGDAELYERYARIIDDVNSLMYTQHIESTPSFDDNMNIVLTTEFEESGVIYKEVTKNGVTTELYYESDNGVIDYKFLSDTSEFMLDPINKSMYVDSTEAVVIEMKDAGGTSVIQEYTPSSILKKRLNLKHLESKDLRFIDEEEEALKMMEFYKSLGTNVPVVVDYETTSKNMHRYSDGKITGLVIGHSEDTGYYYPFNQRKTKNLPIKYLQMLLDSVSHTITIAHNKKFEEICQLKHNLKFNIKVCTMLLAQIATGMPLGMSYGLKSLYEDITGERNLELTDIFKGQKNIMFDVLDKDTIVDYACPDGYSPIILYKHYMKYINEAQKGLLEKIEYRLSPIKALAEFEGIRFDKEGLSDSRVHDKRDLEVLEKLFKLSVNRDININSPVQLEDVIYDKLNAPAKVFTTKKKRSTGALALKYISSIKNPNYDKESTTNMKNIPSSRGTKNGLIKAEDLAKSAYPAVVVLEKYKKINKVVTTYYNKFIDNPYPHYNMWVNINGGRSGRQSSQLHQLPKDITKYALPDSEDHYLLDADWSQVELRMLFYLANESEMIELCKIKNMDIHRAILSEIAKKEIYLISSEERKKGKATNFGVVYDMSDRGLAVNRFGANPTTEQIEECRQSIIDFETTFKRSVMFKEKVKDFLIKNEYVETIMGRKRAFPDINNSNLPKSTIKAMMRQARNTPIQGSCADYMKLAEVRINDELEKRGYLNYIDTPQGSKVMARILISVHDEILLSSHKSIPKWEIIKIAMDAMTFVLGGIMPLYPSVGIGRTWYEAKSDENAIPIDTMEEIVENQMDFGSDTDESIEKILDFTRQRELDRVNSYMEDLIVNCTDRETLWEQVKHPIYTHTLIGLYEDKSIEEHIDRIKHAVNSYLKDYDDGNIAKAKHVVKESEIDEEDDYEKELSAALLGESGYIDVNPDGSYVVSDLLENIEDYEEDVDSLFGSRDDIYFGPAEFVPASYITEAMDSCFVDITNVHDDADIDKITKILEERHKPKSMLAIQLIVGERIINTGLRCERISELSEIEEIIKINNKRVYG